MKLQHASKTTMIFLTLVLLLITAVSTYAKEAQGAGPLCSGGQVVWDANGNQVGCKFNQWGAAEQSMCNGATVFAPTIFYFNGRPFPSKPCWVCISNSFPNFVDRVSRGLWGGLLVGTHFNTAVPATCSSCMGLIRIPIKYDWYTDISPLRVGSWTGGVDLDGQIDDEDILMGNPTFVSSPVDLPDATSPNIVDDLMAQTGLEAIDSFVLTLPAGTLADITAELGSDIATADMVAAILARGVASATLPNAPFSDEAVLELTETADTLLLAAEDGASESFFQPGAELNTDQLLQLAEQTVFSVGFAKPEPDGGDNPPDPTGDYVDGELLVSFEGELTAEEINDIIQQNGTEILGQIEELDVYRLGIADGTAVEAMALRFQELPQVLYAEPNYVATIDQTPNDSSFTSQWGLNNTGQTGGSTDADIDAPEAWDITVGDDDVLIAIVDTGIDYTHQDLSAGRYQGGYDFHNNDSDPMDDHGHGTHVAGIATADSNNSTGMAGVSWASQFIGVKVLSASGSGTYYNVAQGIIYAAGRDADVINLSLGGSSPSTVVQNALQFAQNAGTLNVCAAGNTGGAILYPGEYDNECLTVAATDHNDNRASFSSQGPALDVAAPGVSIYSTLPGNSYASWNGTSMATPHVAGQAALILAQNPSFTVDELTSCIRDTADDVNGGGEDNQLGTGRINAYRSLTECSSNGRMIIEAEDFTRINGDMQLHYDWSAGGDNTAVSVPNGTNTTATPDEARYIFTAPASGTYAFRGRVHAPTGADDSFCVALLNPATGVSLWTTTSPSQCGGRIYWDFFANGNWQEAQLRDGWNGASSTPVTVSLTAGQAYEIVISLREDGTTLDYLELYVP